MKSADKLARIVEQVTEDDVERWIRSAMETDGVGEYARQMFGLPFVGDMLRRELPVTALEELRRVAQADSDWIDAQIVRIVGLLEAIHSDSEGDTDGEVHGEGASLGRAEG